MNFDMTPEEAQRIAAAFEAGNTERIEDIDVDVLIRFLKESWTADNEGIED